MTPRFPPGCAVDITDVGEVQHEPGWDSETAPAPSRGHRQVDLSGKRVGKIVGREGRLMGEHPGLLGPQPEHDEVPVSYTHLTLPTSDLV